MKEFNLYAKLRETSTGGDLNKLRKQGFIPGVFYGKNKNINIYCFINDLKGLIYSGEVFKVNLRIENNIYKCILSDMQNHPLTDLPIHLDFMEITDDKVVKLVYPIHFVGASIGVRQGGKLFKKMRKIHLKGRLADMPETFNLDISKLNIGESIRYKDVQIPAVEILDQGLTTIVSVTKTRIVEETAAAEAPATTTETKSE
jgi:large subunit ribosomal protein L25